MVWKINAIVGVAIAPFPELTHRTIYYSFLSIRQPVGAPAWPKVRAIESHVEATRVYVVQIPVNLNFGASRALTPKRDYNGVVTIVIQNASRNREVNLVADIWVESPILIPIDEQQSSEMITIPRFRWCERRV